MKEVWKNRALPARYCSPVVHAGHLFGLSNGRLICVDAATGKKKWDDGDYGNALLTRYRPLAVRHIDLSVRGCEPRGAIDAQLECNAIESGTFALRVIATHLGLRPGERRWQVKRLLTALAEAPEQPTILLGDVNEWFLWGRPLRWLHAYFERTPHVSTFPSRMPFLALDRIWTSPRAHLVAVTSHRTALSRLASDHLPLLARMRLTSR